MSNPHNIPITVLPHLQPSRWLTSPPPESLFVTDWQSLSANTVSFTDNFIYPQQSTEVQICILCLHICRGGTRMPWRCILTGTWSQLLIMLIDPYGEIFSFHWEVRVGLKVRIMELVIIHISGHRHHSKSKYYWKINTGCIKPHETLTVIMQPFVLCWRKTLWLI